jgi:hypothetical protein
MLTFAHQGQCKDLTRGQPFLVYLLLLPEHQGALSWGVLRRRSQRALAVAPDEIDEALQITLERRRERDEQRLFAWLPLRFGVRQPRQRLMMLSAMLYRLLLQN